MCQEVQQVLYTHYLRWSSLWRKDINLHFSREEMKFYGYQPAHPASEHTCLIPKSTLFSSWHSSSSQKLLSREPDGRAMPEQTDTVTDVARFQECHQALKGHKSSLQHYFVDQAATEETAVCVLQSEQEPLTGGRLAGCYSLGSISPCLLCGLQDPN